MLNALRRGAEIVAATLFTAMFGAFLLQVFMRYVVNAPLPWTLEFCLIAYLWTTFWGCAFLLRERDHIGFTLLYDGASPRGKRALAILGTALIAVTFVAALPATWDYISFMAIDHTWVLQLRFDYVYSVFLVFMLAVIARATLRLRGLLGRDWHEHI